jgi:hypothetical protein
MGSHSFSPKVVMTIQRKTCSYIFGWEMLIARKFKQCELLCEGVHSKENPMGVWYREDVRAILNRFKISLSL